MADPFIEAIGLAIDEADANVRVCMPGKVTAVQRDEGGELDVDFDPGPARRQDGVTTADGIIPSAPVLYPGGGGFAVTWPLAAGDEALAVVADRNTMRWRKNREPGDAHSFSRSHNLSDALVLGFSMTGPDAIGDTYKVTGPAGVAIEVAANGDVTISSNSTPPSTIMMTADGNVTIEVGLGRTVDIGGSSINSATMWQPLSAALDAFITALVAAGAGPGYTGAGAAQSAYQAAIGANSPSAQKVKVE